MVEASEREAPFTAKHSFIRPCPIPGEFQLTFPLGSWTLLQFRRTTNEKRKIYGPMEVSRNVERIQELWMPNANVAQFFYPMRM